MIRPDFGERRSELHTLARAFDASLAARGRSPMTRKSYREAIVLLADFLDEWGVAADVDAVTKTDLEAFIADQLVRWKPATAAVRFRSLQQFWKWATAECELPENPMARMEPPLTPILDLDAKRRLVAACAGPMFENVRDEAIIRRCSSAVSGGPRSPR